MLIVCLIMQLFSIQLSAQNVLEFAKINGDGNPTGNGPIAETTIQFLKNINNPSGNTFEAYTPEITATFQITNQQFTHSGIPTGRPVNIGWSQGASSNIYDNLDDFGLPQASWFTSANSTPGTGIDIVENRGIALTAATRPLRYANLPTNGRYHMANLVITFNRPVKDPILHIAGMGGYSYATVGTELGFSAEFDLDNSNVPVTFTKLSGSNALSVNTNQILNNASSIYNTGTDRCGSGSVKVSGSGITSLTLKVYIRGDGRSPFPMLWDYTGNLGDSVNLSISLSEDSSPGYCYRPAATTGTVLDTKHGITALGRAGATNDNWPMVRKGAWTALEAKTKGFVINRIPSTAQVTAIANPVEGMMVYDEEAACLKIYTTTDGGSTFGWKCFNTQTCPE
ncbi:hypothetical protein HNP38_003180 [Chryseobacterium defluvii]|uniref:Uncharacterized protein n=1 Tax=Chryseobacterium defluvii TaxID=160396 RepID=A0A840KJL6_9FLAO|nr:hypothetical protein [Chryseobacterium defluvii]MBB4807864.1 hypothetical protein [Chryseobacterium defluvii]